MKEAAGFASLLVASFWLSVACSTGTTPAGASGDDGGTSSGSGSGSGSSSGSASSSGSGSSSGTSSGSSSGAGIPTTGVCANGATRILTNSQADAFIDDFEGTAGISQGWSSFNDVAAGTGPFQIAQVAGGAVNTTHSGRYAGTGAKTTATGGYGVGTLYNTGIVTSKDLFCIDISAFSGVSFWAKAGTAGSTISLNFVLPQSNMVLTNDAGVHTGGGDCETNCYDYPHVTFTLTTSWAQYTGTFAGATGGTATVGSVIQEVEWLSPDANWDFTLDEIAFYSGTAPAGAVGPNPAGGGITTNDDSGAPVPVDAGADTGGP